MLNTLDLFAGIGGFSLGLERTGGFRTAAFCEIDPAARKVLNKHWPTVPIYEDVSALTKEKLDADGITIDAITGGFPCQDISLAGKGAGLAGSRSGLWFQLHRLIAEIRPQVVIAENVSALRSRGLDSVLRSLAEIGYDAEWHCIPAATVGAPHRRDRIWIVAYPTGERCGEAGELRHNEPPKWTAGRSENVAHPTGEWRNGGGAGSELARRAELTNRGWWATEPNVGRVAHGVPKRVDRLKQLGNAVVPQIPELLGNAIIAAT